METEISVWSSDDVWRHRSGLKSVQMMACWLETPCHHRNQGWFLISRVLWQSPETNFTGSAQDIVKWFWKIHLRITIMSQERHAVSVHRLLEWWCNSWFGLQSNKHQRFDLLALCDGNQPVTGGFPHKGSVMGKSFPFHDVSLEIFSASLTSQWFKPAAPP